MSSIAATFTARPVTLEQLAALSDELAALARAGVPLDRGLRALAQDMPGRLGRLAGDVSRRLEEGRPLDQVVAELGTALPPAYRSVIVAGARAGRLPAALEGVAHTARRIALLRNSIFLSLLYPLIVLCLTWLLGLAIVIKVVPVMSEMLVEFDAAGPWVVEFLKTAERNAFWFGPLLPTLFGAWLVWAWFRAGRVAAGRELLPTSAFGVVGTLARLQRASRLSSLADLLALLVSNGVPLPDAIELASEAVGQRVLARGGKQMADQLRRGEIIRTPPAGFPPLLAWTIAGGHSQPRLVRTLERTAEVYRDEVSRRSQWLAIYIPLVVTLVVCGGAVFCYGMLTLGPWIMIMRRLALPY
jgi:general secretion pathway protein F